MKAFVISDIHSFYDQMIDALKKAGYDKENPNHMLIVLGDLLDRGPDPVKCLDFINSIPDSNKILIKGNHEDLIEEAMSRHYFANHDYHNRTYETALALSGLDMSEGEDAVLEAAKCNEAWQKYINSTIDYYETSKYVFVHGWIPTGLTVSQDAKWKNLPDIYKPAVMGYIKSWRHGNWYDARWTNGMNAWYQGIVVPKKTVYCGHYHTSWGWANLRNDGVEFLNPIETMYIDPETGKQEPHAVFDAFKDKGICAIDACTALTGKVNIEVINRFPKKV